MTLKVKVISPDQVVVDDEAEEVILPSTTGQLGILTDHVPLLTALDIGVMRLRKDKSWQSIALMGGFAEIEENELTILVNGAQTSSDIDADAARNELVAAEERLSKVDSSNKQEKLQAEQALRRARARVQAVTANS
ncbi:ATP synthase F1 subcomplex epsilon subunit [Thalassoporum mexicanum PCC 7367]|uniref:ATP synthase F1 subunit epsilon n=1 Tax=Thalassoporum mexicanum TaxID=3457544 RepID=UPI00029FA9C8|nr:ATP synthase F1 subunit epsilon [Pseudanabaena sp. PCC 7367]AFY69184.1 ATP synthase F1 subcomplex epsilon subunit [Pseudanabaena sp. PCC 7367]